MRSAEISRMVASELEADPETTKRTLAIMQMVAELEGTPLTRNQHFGASAIGGAMRVYDDAFDKYDIRTARRNGKEILAMVAGDGEAPDLDPLVRRSLQMAHENLNPVALGALRDLTTAQIDSLEQRDDTIAMARLDNITRRKGESAALLFALEVNPQMSPERQLCFKELGYLMQLADDMADSTIDTEAGITTLATLDAEKVKIGTKIKQQSGLVKGLLEKNYEPVKLKKIFSYINLLLAKTGIVMV